MKREESIFHFLCGNTLFVNAWNDNDRNEKTFSLNSLAKIFILPYNMYVDGRLAQVV